MLVLFDYKYQTTQLHMKHTMTFEEMEMLVTRCLHLMRTIMKIGKFSEIVYCVVASTLHGVIAEGVTKQVILVNYVKWLYAEREDGTIL